MIQKRVGHLNQTPTTTYSYATFETAIRWFCLMFRHATFTTAIWWFCLMRRRLERRRTLYKWLGVSMTATFPRPFHCFLPWFQANKNLRLTYIFWDFLRYFEFFWDFLRYFEIFWDFLRPSPNTYLWRARYFEIFWEILRYFEIFWDILRNFEKFWEILRNFEKFWENLRNFEKFWVAPQFDFFNCPITFFQLSNQILAALNKALLSAPAAIDFFYCSGLHAVTQGRFLSQHKATYKFRVMLYVEFKLAGRLSENNPKCSHVLSALLLFSGGALGSRFQNWMTIDEE